MTIDRAHAMDVLRQMLLIRRFEEKAAEVYTLGKIRGFLHLYIGEEAVAVGAMQALTPEDAIVATYREHGQALARGIPAASSWQRCTVRPTAAAGAAVAPCISSTCRAGSSAATPSWAAGFPSRWVWPWPTPCSRARASPRASSVTEPWPRASSTSR